MQEFADHPIDIIVPIYRGFNETRRCIGSVLANPCRMPFELIVINDCGPDATLTGWLREGAAQGRFTLLENETNLGFVATANRGITLHADRDVVLLNSDTEVANDWLDRLRACAYREPDIGTVTPFSNNATICSYPFEGWDTKLPGDLGFAELDRVFASTNAGLSVDLPTAVGFCMYIRRACIDQVGLFDVERFGRGYGEENDFSLRASKAGWRSVLAGDVYIFHEGGVSFSESRSSLQKSAMTALLEAHPDYMLQIREFQERDPAASLRKAVDRARFALGVEEGLHVLDEQGRRYVCLRDRLARVDALEEGLAHAEALVRERDALIKALEEGLGHAEALVRERDAGISGLREALERSEAALNRIRNSWAWKCLNLLIRRDPAPPGSGAKP